MTISMKNVDESDIQKKSSTQGKRRPKRIAFKVEKMPQKPGLTRTGTRTLGEHNNKGHFFSVRTKVQALVGSPGSQ